MEALFRNALHFTTFSFYLVKFSTQGIIPSKSDSFFLFYLVKFSILSIIPSKRDSVFLLSGKI